MLKIRLSSAFLTTLPVCLLSACVTSDDPADGGFVSGVAGITSGSYQARVDSLEAQATAEQARNADLSRQINAAEADLSYQQSKLKTQLATTQGVSRQMSTKVNRVISYASPAQNSDAKLSDLQRTIAEAKSLSLELAQLSN
ncbi:hypothetical protein [Shimia sagamensis]|uniref:Lipoprotein n=1 Tax=Shimia sagamensis TaxID=1566352 RepID=A0ABY1PIA6_9RHOB|nr:hypothetical protein [Shimia sagamensis]SMP34787.1 hypothetical protein SAMN06265373_11097 [Shimia sagamensis]